jgi:hypothetical protein
MILFSVYPDLNEKPGGIRTGLGVIPTLLYCKEEGKARYDL